MKYDVVIFGAGIAGIYAAHHLSRQNFRVLLVEKRRQFIRKICGEYICPSGVTRLKVDGFGEFIKQRFNPVTGLQITSPAGIPIYSPFSEDHQIQGISIRRGYFESELLTASHTKNTDVCFGCKPRQIERRNGEYHIVLSDGNTVTGKLIVGADGIFSQTASLLNLQKKTTQDRVALHAIVENKMPNRKAARMYILPDGAYIGLNPHGDTLNVTLVCDTKMIKILKGTETTYTHYINRSGIDFLKKIPCQQKIKKLSPVTSRVKKNISYRAALIGDSAGFIDPLTGEGISMAMQSAYMFAESVGEIKPEKLTDDAETKKVLDRFTKTQSAYFFQKRLLNHSFQRLIRYPKACDMLARYLSVNERQHHFIETVSNIISPMQGIIKIVSANRPNSVVDKIYR